MIPGALAEDFVGGAHPGRELEPIVDRSGWERDQLLGDQRLVDRIPLLMQSGLLGQQ